MKFQEEKTMTYQKPALSFALVQASMEAMVEKAKQLPNPVAIAIVDASGVASIVELGLSDAELAALRHSAEVLRAARESLS
jgi:uncharacterized protein GlcG (DUF336 family)